MQDGDSEGNGAGRRALSARLQPTVLDDESPAEAYGGTKSARAELKGCSTAAILLGVASTMPHTDQAGGRMDMLQAQTGEGSTRDILHHAT